MSSGFCTVNTWTSLPTTGRGRLTIQKVGLVEVHHGLLSPWGDIGDSYSVYKFAGKNIKWGKISIGERKIFTVLILLDLFSPVNLRNDGNFCQRCVFLILPFPDGGGGQ